MRKSVLAFAAGVAVGTATVALLGSSSPANAANARPSQQERFSVLATSQHGSPVVVATGPEHALGSVQDATSKSLTLAFSNGSLTVGHKMKGNPASSFDTKTCLHTYSEHGLWRTTKATKHLSGSLGIGTYSTDVRWVQCGKHAPVKVYMSDTEFTGRLVN